MLKYELRTRFLSGSYSVSLTKSEHDEILQARNSLLNTLYIEEAFDILIDNYLDFETTLLQSAFSQMIRLPTVAGFQSERRLFNRKLINLLSTGKAYVDSTDQKVCIIFGRRSKERDKITTKKSKAKDTNHGYRFMEELRNYSQHRGWPIHGLVYHNELVGEDIANGKLRTNVAPYSSTKFLEEDSRLRTLLSELGTKGEDFDIIPLVREYVEVLADIHKEVRETLQPRTQKSEEVILATINRFEQESGGRSVGLELTSENGDKFTTVYVIKELVTSRQELERKNQNLINLPKRFVTSEIIEKRKNR